MPQPRKITRPYGTGTVSEDTTRGRWIGRYDAGWTAEGKRDRRRVYGKTEREAHNKLDALIKSLKSGDAPQAGSAARTSLKVWLDRWQPLRAQTLRPTAYQADDSLIRNWIIPHAGKRRLVEISPGDVRRVTDAMLTAGLAPSSARRAHMVLIKALKDAVREGYPIPQRTLMTIAPAAGPTDRTDIPLPDALDLLRTAGEHPSGSRHVMALLQGMRQAEALGLRWSAIDLDNATVDISWQLKPLPYRIKYDRDSGFRVPTGHESIQLDGALHLVRPKTAAGTRVFPLTGLAVAILRAWKDIAPASPHDLVWPRPDGRPGLAPDDDRAWYDLQDRAQVAHVVGDTGRRYSTHEARHTTATLLMAAGVDVKVIGQILGQSSIAATRGYQHVSLDLARDGLAAMMRQLEASTDSG